jgi:hypothetical protein
MTKLAGFFVVLVALGANAWMLGLEFQYCDYDDIPDVGWMIGAEPAPNGVPWVEAIRLRAYSFRPALWAVLWALRGIAGDPVRPIVFHGFFLAAHALASLLLFRILSARLGALAGLVGGALFAILPGGIQAVSWITAGGDQLAVLFMLAAAVASDRALRTRSALAIAGCGVATFCAVASKESAVMLLPGLALLWLIPPASAAPSRGPRIALAFAAASGVAGAWALRAWAFGSWSPRYWGGAPRPQWWQLRALPTALRGFLVPWVADGDVASPWSVAGLRGFGLDDATTLAVLTGAAVAAVLLPIVVALVLSDGRRRAALLAVAAFLLFVVLPVLPLTNATGLGLSRALYQAALVLSALVACAVGAPRPRTVWRVASVAPLILLSADLLAHTARAELRMASRIHDARADLARLAAASAETRLLLIDPPEWIGNVPFVGAGLADAVCPPFGKAPKGPLVWPAAETLRRSPAITGEPSGLRIVVWDGRQLVPRGTALPPIPSSLPELEADSEDGLSFRTRAAAPPRAIAGVRLALRAGAPEGRVTLAAEARSLERPFAAPAAGSRVVGIPDAAFGEEWFGQAGPVAVRVTGGRLARPPQFLRTQPPIAVTAAGREGRFDLASPPTVSFVHGGEAAAFRVVMEFIVARKRVSLAWSPGAAGLPADAAGLRTFVARGPGTVTADGRTIDSLDWAAAAALIAPSARGADWSMPVDLRVEALDETRVNPVACSEWLHLSLVRS